MIPPLPNASAKGVPSDADGKFVHLLNGHHRRLLGYLAALVGNRQDAEDVLQRVSVTLWRKFDTFVPGTDFMAWASMVAFYEARNFLRVSGRAQVAFDDSLLDLMARERAADLSRQESRLEALEHCMEKLDEDNREMVRAVYLDRLSIAKLAARWKRAPQTLYNRLNFIRRALAECIETRLQEGRLS